jgi:DNA-binding HxlR family transcriptional regulator
MIFDGKTAYVEFLASEEKIASNILNDRLKTLVNQGFLRKRVSPDNRSKFLYSLTEKAIDLFPLLMEYQSWGAKYNPQDIPKPITDEWAKRRPAFLKKQQERLRREHGATE